MDCGGNAYRGRRAFATLIFISNARDGHNRNHFSSCDHFRLSLPLTGWFERKDSTTSMDGNMMHLSISAIAPPHRSTLIRCDPTAQDGNMIATAKDRLSTAKDGILLPRTGIQGNNILSAWMVEWMVLFMGVDR